MAMTHKEAMGMLCVGDTVQFRGSEGEHRIIKIKLLFIRLLSPFPPLVHEWFPGFASGQAIFSDDVAWVHFKPNSFPDQSVHVSGFS
jgi:hypothetical protein